MSASIIVCALGLGVGLISVLFSAPLFAVGVWQQSEPVVMAAHAGAALCWLGLAAVPRPGDLLVRLRSPLVYPVLLLALWGGVSASLSEHPMGAVLGAPQSGEGVLWSLDAAAYLLAAWSIRDGRPDIFRHLAFLGAGVVVIVGLCNAPILRAGTVVGAVPSFFSFPKFLGFSAIGLFPVAWWLRTNGRRGGLAILMAAVAGLLLSGNRAAMCGSLMILPIAMPPRLLPAWNNRRLFLALGTGGVLVAALLPYLLLRHTDWFQGSFSLWSRSILLAVVDGRILDGWGTALFGHGWGNYQEYLARHVADTGISLVDGSWKDLTRDEFHSHSAVMEAAFAVGLPGAVLMLLSRIGMVWGAAPAALGMAILFVLGLSITEATWFMLPVSLAFLGLALAALAPRVEIAPSPTWGEGAIRAAAAATAITGIVLTLLLFGHARVTRQLVTCIKANHCESARPPRDLIGSEGETAAMILTIVRGRTGAFDNRSLAAMVRGIASRPDRPRSALLSLALCTTFGRAAFMPATSRFGPLIPQDEILWREEVIRLLDVAPGRLDVAAIYLNWLIKQGREADDDRVLPMLERRVPSHPVVLWFRGLRMIAGPDEDTRRAGILKLRQALEGGVRRFVEIPPDVDASLHGAAARP